MSGYNWTDEQLLAIEEKGTDLLVSAAAGSGKTAVLTERIIRQLIDTKNPVDITDFLIVTFTVSATTEVREKLSRAIRNAYQENKSLKRLKRQILNLPSAKILTIDSFCKFIVNECSKQLNIPADFQLGDESELNVITSSVISEVLDSFFDGYEGEYLFDTSYLPASVKRGFLSVVEAFTTQKSFDLLNDTVIGMYNKLVKYPDPINRAKSYLQEYDSMLQEHYVQKSGVSFFDTRLGKFVIDDVKESLHVAIKYFEEAEALLSPFDEMCAKYSPAIQDDIAAATRLSANDGSELVKALSTYSATRLAPYRSKNDEEKRAQEKFKSLRDTAKDLITSLKKKYPIYDEEKLFLQVATTFSIANELFSVVIEFYQRLWKAKVEKKTFSFDDVAQLAYKALIRDGSYDKTTRQFERTDYARELGEKFHEILIDEYQDVNELQDAIFRAISNSHNRFMVGDLKQSIYKFRGATPEIFIEYRNTFSPISSTDETPRLIALQRNFRSDSAVIDFVNSLFEVIMNYRSEDVYRKDDYLTFSKSEDMKLPTEISIFNTESEYEYVADKILETVNGDQSFNFGDICILARKHDSLKNVQKVLSGRGIPSDYTPNEKFFTSFEIHTIHSLLKAIDNPTDDVSLLSALTSPIFSFSPIDILTVRRLAPYGDIYFAIRDYNGGNPELQKKCQRVINKLKYWHNKSKVISSDAFIWWLYKETHLPTFVKKMDNGEQRKENLLAFYNIASKYEEREFNGITKFLSYLDAFINSKSKLGKRTQENNSVHLMTIHESKGLEFPVCFYVSSSSLISRADERKKIVMSEVFGPTFAIPVGELGGKLNTYAEKAAIAETREGTVDEELRLLYVALTRAKNKLFITADTDIAGLRKYLELATVNRTAFIHSVKNASSMFKIIGLGLYTEPIFKKVLDSFCEENATVSSENLTVNLFNDYEPLFLTNTEVEKSEEERPVTIKPEDISFALKPVSNPLLTETPFKISVSSIREGLLDEGAEATVASVKKYPDFTSLDSSNLSSFTGTAMHVFMQFCDFKACVENGTEAEAERLVKYGFITEEQKNVLNHLTLSAFFNSKTYKSICKAKRIEREKRYTLLLPSSKFYTDEDKKASLDALGKKTLIQGVIDCYFVNEDNTVTLIDFKTDNVSVNGGEKVLRERHSHQIQMYKEAIEEIEGLKVSKAVIYSFCLSKEIEI
ncbi:MAG: UvrD-helicase domain-containing protein [Clostridia bacterium]|nr:UvrD-helicase domain-containing protein [Clostridia bacterium]